MRARSLLWRVLSSACLGLTVGIPDQSRENTHAAVTKPSRPERLAGSP